MDAEKLYRDPLAWARDRRVVLPAEYYGAQSALARAKAFSIAGITRLDAIDAVKQTLNAALATGETFADWKARLLADPKALQAAMLPAHRLDNIFRTNLQSAYMAGVTRAQETPLAKKLRPFYQYDAINDSRTRPAHVAMDNYIAPADDLIWQTWTAPCGYRCRCTRIALSEAQARARGWTGEKKPLPAGAKVDEGWGVHPLADDGLAGVKAALKRRQDSFPQGSSAKALNDIEQVIFEQSTRRQIDVYDSLLARIEPDLSTPARATAVAIEDGIRRDALETGAFIDTSGNVMLRKQGAPDRVTFTIHELFNKRGTTFTHNHPGGASFSAADLNLFAVFEFGEMRAITTNARHIVRPLGLRWPNPNALTDLDDEALKSAQEIVNKMIATGQLERGLFELEVSHQYVLFLSQRTGFFYLREGS
jgi:SPP1 gp7 family putative phage head morphogenesis protein